MVKRDPQPEDAELVTDALYRLRVADGWILYEMDVQSDSFTVVAIVRAESS
jgi:hypothetical protein